MDRNALEARVRTISSEDLETLLDIYDMSGLKPFQSIRASDSYGVASLLQNEHFIVVQEEVRNRRDMWGKNFAHGLLTRKEPIDQREVDEKRGYWTGAMWFAFVLPQMAQLKLTRATKESDSQT